MGSRKRIETKIDEDTEPNMADESETDIDVTDEHESVETNTQIENGRQSRNLDCNSNNKTCDLNNVVKDDFRMNHSKLTFGIDRLLKEESRSDHNDNSIAEYIIDSEGVLDRKPADITQHSDFGADTLNDSYNMSDDEERHDLDDLRMKSAAFEAENARARLALLRYSSTFSVYNSVNGGHCIQPGAATHQTMFQPSFTVNSVETGYTAWSSVAATSPEARKDRFGFVRRVGHPYQNRTPPKRKKPRTSFTRLQILELEKRFERQKYLASTERSALAKTLKMTDAQVKTWFQNRRTKWRRQTAEEREIERQAANRLLLSLHSEPSHRKSVVIPSDPVCLSHFRRWQDQRPADV